MDELISIINNLLSSDNNIRKKAEYDFNNKKENELPYLTTNLFMLINSDKDKKLADMASVLYKNIINEKDNWFNLSFTAKENIRQRLFEFIDNCYDASKVKNYSIILANIINIEMSKFSSNTLYRAINKIDINNKDNKKVVVYLYLIQTFFDLYSNASNNNKLPFDVLIFLLSYLMPIIKIANKEVNLEILKYALKLFESIIPFFIGIFNSSKNSSEIVLPILNFFNKSISCDLFLIIISILHDIILYYHKFLNDFYDNILDNIINKIEEFDNNNNKDILNKLLNILCIICDEEQKILLKETFTKVTVYCQKNELKIVKILIKLIQKYTETIIFQEENFDTSKECCYILSYFIKNATKELTLDYILDNAIKTLDSSENNLKLSSILLFNVSLDTPYLNKLYDSLSPIMEYIIKKLNDTNQIYLYSVSWLLGKISEVRPKLFSRQKFYEFIPFFINIIKNISSEPNKYVYSFETRINISIVFSNIIKFYGKDNKSKLSGPFTSYYKLYLLDFLFLSESMDCIFSGLSTYLLRPLLLSVSFPDDPLIDSLEPLLMKTVGVFKNSLQKVKGEENRKEIKNINGIGASNKYAKKNECYSSNDIENIKTNKIYKNHYDNEKINDNIKLLWDYYCMLINQIFTLINKNINIELCYNIFETIYTSLSYHLSDIALLSLYNVISVLFRDSSISLLSQKITNLNFSKIFENFSLFLLSRLTESEKNKENKKLKEICVLCLYNVLKCGSYLVNDNKKTLLEAMEAAEKDNDILEIKDILIKIREILVKWNK